MSERLARTREVWENIYESGHRMRYPCDAFVRATRRLLDPRQHRRVLDYGCGSGENLIHLAGCGFDVVGMDVSAEALAVARERLAASGLPGAFRLGTGDAVPFEDGHFDAVVAWHVLDYNDWDSLKALLGELRRVLRPGGVLLCTFRAPGDMLERQGRRIGHGIYRLESGAQAGIPMMILEADEVRALFPDVRVLESGWFGHEVGGVASRHWIFACAC